jgi:hypothetical protein
MLMQQVRIAEVFIEVLQEEQYFLLMFGGHVCWNIPPVYHEEQCQQLFVKCCVDDNTVKFVWVLSVKCIEL